jgi:hypothetical protein
MILFLDFDGVLHPDGFRYPVVDFRYFNRLPKLEGLLRIYPHVRIVISSLWRLRMELPQLREIFSPDIRDRLIGTTPLPLRFDDAIYILDFREREIVRWLEGNGGIDQPWVALDDAPFLNHLGRLVPCQPLVGFDDAAERALRCHFEAAVPKRRPTGTDP